MSVLELFSKSKIVSPKVHLAGNYVQLMLYARLAVLYYRYPSILYHIKNNTVAAQCPILYHKMLSGAPSVLDENYENPNVTLFFFAVFHAR